MHSDCPQLPPSVVSMDWRQGPGASAARGMSRDRMWGTVSAMSDQERETSGERRPPLKHPEELLDDDSREELHAHLERMARSRRNVRAASATLRFG